MSVSLLLLEFTEKAAKFQAKIDAMRDPAWREEQIAKWADKRDKLQAMVASAVGECRVAGLQLELPFSDDESDDDEQEPPHDVRTGVVVTVTEKSAETARAILRSVAGGRAS